MHSLTLIETNTKSLFDGRPDDWMNVSNQLYKLLCDRKPLIKQVIPSLVLPPVRNGDPHAPPEHPDRVLTFAINWQTSYGPGWMGISLCDASQPSVHWAEWLNYILAVSSIDGVPVPITVRELIAFARNQAGGGHFDPEIHAVTQVLERHLWVIEFGSRRLEALPVFIALIGSVVVDEVRRQLPPETGESP
jgi:hypothetical protein